MSLGNWPSGQASLPIAVLLKSRSSSDLRVASRAAPGVVTFVPESRNRLSFGSFSRCLMPASPICVLGKSNSSRAAVFRAPPASIADMCFIQAQRLEFREYQQLLQPSVGDRLLREFYRSQVQKRHNTFQIRIGQFGMHCVDRDRLAMFIELDVNI